MMKKVKSLFFLCSTIIILCLSTNLLAVKKKVFPSEEIKNLYDYSKDFPGYKKSYGPKYYSKDTLFDYIDGGAPAYLGRGFLEVLGFELENAENSGKKLLIDVYNMGNGENAEKIFDKEKSGKNITVSNKLRGDITDNQLKFIKNKYYIKVTGYTDTDSDNLIAIADMLSSKIKEK